MASKQLPFRSVPEMFLHRVAATPDTRALGGPAPDGRGEPVWSTWREVGDRARALGAGLHALGVRREHRVAIAATTRVEWVLADLGVMCAGGATTTVYPTTDAEDAVYILRDSGSSVLVAEDASQVAKIAGADLPDLLAVVLMDGEPGGVDVPAGVRVLTMAELERSGAEVLAERPVLIEELVAEVGPKDLATLIYTSGTTGRPKGVQLLHEAWVWEGYWQIEQGLMRSDDLHYLWLPLSHSFGKTLLCGMVQGAVTTYVDGRVDKIVENLGAIRPTLMCAAPRVFEKVYNRVATSARDAGGAKARIFSWAVDVGRRASAERLAGRAPGGVLAAQARVADRLVFSKLRTRLGGRIRVLVSGSAPLSVPVAEFFAAAGLPISEGYGLTESAAGSFVNRPGALRVGTVGQAIGDLECRIAEDGEVLLRGTPVMSGYYHLPAETAAALTEDGWLHTGDIGELDADGYLRITDRKKDLIKTSGGKYVAPSRIEGLFKSICPYVSQALVIGQSRNYCTMLVTLDPDAIPAWAEGGPLAGKPYAEIAASDEAREMVAGYVKELNTKLNRWETVKKFLILPQDLSVERGELTPSLKVKRKAVEKEYAAEVEALYSGTLAEV